MRRSIAILATLAAFASAASAQRATPGQRIFESQGIPSGASSDNEESLLVSFWDEHVRFRVPKQPEDRLAKLQAILIRSLDSGQSVSFTYDASEGRVNRETGTLDFPLCGATLEGATFEPVVACSTAPSNPSASADSALALAYAFSNLGEHAQARKLLQRAEPADEPAFRKLLLRIRADAAILSVDEPWSESADRAHLAALNDYRELATIQPDDVELQFSIADALEELGDYDEARIVLDRIPRRWTDEKFRTAVRIGALYRRQGENERALEQLDDFVAKNPDPRFRGMKFHYHRGWTLTRMKRFDEAVAEFDKGLQRQPDYPYAYFRRACAQASRGRIADALTDVERGRKLLAEAPAKLDPIEFDIRRADAVILELKRARETADYKPMPGICEGYWGRSDEARSKSPLLR